MKCENCKTKIGTEEVFEKPIQVIGGGILNFCSYSCLVSYFLKNQKFWCDEKEVLKSCIVFLKRLVKNEV
jgi:hypothetical protein